LSQMIFAFSTLLPQFIKEKLIQNTTTQIFNAQNSFKRI
jgi:hypothetical protein